MNPDSGKLYTPDEVDAMTEKERDHLTWISKAEWAKLSRIEEDERPRILQELRAQEQKFKANKRKAQKQARKKNR